MTVTHPDGTVELYDENGTLRVRMGNLDTGGFMSQAVHVTCDGEYVTSSLMDAEWYKAGNASKMVATYPGHQAWCRATGMGSDWYTIPVAGLGFSRWDTIAEKDVPECVRMAEIMR